MIANHSIKWYIGAFICSALVSSTTSDEKLVNFNFEDRKNADWDEEVLSFNKMELNDEGKLQENVDSFEDPNALTHQSLLLDLRESTLRKTLTKALSDSALRQKFVEVIPILRVLTPQQRLTLSALISSQISSKPGRELKLDQVKYMFGDSDKKLMLPLVYDIANLIRSSAKKSIHQNSDDFQVENNWPQTSISRRTINLTPEELAKDGDVTQNKTIIEDSSLEDFLSNLNPNEVLDAKIINEALQDTKAYPIKRQKRLKRSTLNFIHKLTRSVSPQSEHDSLSGKSLQLNTSSFLIPNEDRIDFDISSERSDEVNSTTLSYQEIEELAFVDLNGTETKTDSIENNSTSYRENEEQLPNPEELIAGPYYRINGNKLRLPIPKMGSKRKRIQILRSKLPPITQNKCERFTASMCIRADDYPLEQIMGSIRRHKNAMSALLAEFYDKAHEIESFDELLPSKRRDDENEINPGGMCASIVTYARPQKARSASGEWKYIVNTGKHTQTLRFEKCSKPQESCSYLSRSYRSRCAQVYNYHRLLSWDKTRGLHVDIFKVPTCCSCRVDGFRERFVNTAKAKDSTSSSYNQNLHSLINDDLDYVDEEDDEDAFRYHFGNDYKQSGDKTQQFYDPNELILGSTNVQSQLKVGNSPTVGSYLSPPAGNDDFNTKYVYNGRHPHKSSRVDLEISGSEISADKEVNIYGTNSDKTRVRPKRKRIYSVPTVETAIVYTSSPSLSGKGGGGGGRGGAMAANPTYYSVSSSGSGSNSGGSAFRAPTASTASSSSSSTEEETPISGTNYQNHHHYKHHINSIYGSKYPNHSKGIKGTIATATIATTTDSSKRKKNYSYHPIIDFFENHQKRNEQYGELQFHNNKYSSSSGSKINSMGMSYSSTKNNNNKLRAGAGFSNPKDNIKLMTFNDGDGNHKSNGFVADLEQSWHPVVVNT